jgi:hypothetical protein
MDMYAELEKIENESVVAHFKAFTRHSSGMIEGNH